jgi:hypothetical protein
VEADLQFYEKIKAGSYDLVFNIAEGLHGGAGKARSQRSWTCSRSLTQDQECSHGADPDKRRTRKCSCTTGFLRRGTNFSIPGGRGFSAGLRFPLFVKTE